MKLLKHLVLVLKHVNPDKSSMIINECHEIFATTERFGTNLSTSITVDNLQWLLCSSRRLLKGLSVNFSPSTWFTEFTLLIHIDIQTTDHFVPCQFPNAMGSQVAKAMVPRKLLCTVVMLTKMHSENGTTMVKIVQTYMLFLLRCTLLLVMDEVFRLVDEVTLPSK